MSDGSVLHSCQGGSVMLRHRNWVIIVRPRSERSAARLAHQSGGLGVGSSNLPAPTTQSKTKFRIERDNSFSCAANGESIRDRRKLQRWGRCRLFHWSRPESEGKPMDGNLSDRIRERAYESGCRLAAATARRNSIGSLPNRKSVRHLRSMPRSLQPKPAKAAAHSSDLKPERPNAGSDLKPERFKAQVSTCRGRRRLMNVAPPVAPVAQLG
jgi:hypothetical protein